jgi:hypothetical protein
MNILRVKNQSLRGSYEQLYLSGLVGIIADPKYWAVAIPELVLLG